MIKELTTNSYTCLYCGTSGRCYSIGLSDTPFTYPCGTLANSNPETCQSVDCVKNQRDRLQEQLDDILPLFYVVADIIEGLPETSAKQLIEKK